MSTVHDLPDLAPSADDTAPKSRAAPYASAATYFSSYADEIACVASSVDAAAVAWAAAILLGAYTRGATVFSCGNGGSASIANHLQCDHTKNVGKSTDLCPRVMSLSVNVEVLAAIANDHAYADVFTH
jgi:phosphoheptose isomerase